MLMGVVAVVPVLVAGASYAYLRIQQNKKPQTRVFRCGHCKQQIRYVETQAGRKGSCPRCWKSVMPPTSPEAVTAKAHVVRMKHPLYGRLTSSARR